MSTDPGDGEGTETGGKGPRGGGAVTLGNGTAALCRVSHRNVSWPRTRGERSVPLATCPPSLGKGSLVTHTHRRVGHCTPGVTRGHARSPGSGGDTRMFGAKGGHREPSQLPTTPLPLTSRGLFLPELF